MKSGLMLIAAVIVGASVQAQPAAPEPQIQAPLRDPWVPPQARQPSTTAPTEGAALRAQIEAKLRAGFEAADTKRSGALTRDQARAAGLGIVADNFDRIDTQRRGRVSFDDLKRYLRSQGADL
ncbi:MAG TPA: EF-hand domain-containing protein [Albitalea sp.]|nr:EF-hand domain-containing protein [Albitalea sp.]